MARNNKNKRDQKMAEEPVQNIGLSVLIISVEAFLVAVTVSMFVGYPFQF
jgi:hypothetical protein